VANTLTAPKRWRMELIHHLRLRASTASLIMFRLMKLSVRTAITTSNGECRLMRPKA
jgi:hypothetical protein